MSGMVEKMKIGWVAGWALGLLFLAGIAHAGGEARYFRTQSQADFLAGTLAGIAIDPLGNLSLAERVERVADLGEPFLFSVADHPQGWVVGTGNDGKVLLVQRDGSVEALFATPEPEVFAVWADPDGTVFAGSSPEGKVYRLSKGGAEVYFEPNETYIWGLRRDRRGRLLVATGTEGRLYGVSQKGEGEVVYDGDDTHVRVIESLGDGAVLIGTAGEGLVLRMDEKGDVRTLYDGTEPEVVALAEGPGRTLYAALLASEASLVDLAATRSGEKQSEQEGSESGSEKTEATVTVTGESPATFNGSRPAGFKGARSVVVRIAPSGLVEPLWQFDDETVYDLSWHRDRLWVGTGLDGKLYSFRGGKMVLEKDVDERQIVAIARGHPGPAFATTNAAAVFDIGSESEPSGSYTSAALDAGQIARFGTLRWQGEARGGGRVSFSARSGMSAEPDRTWSGWTTATTGREISLTAVPSGRFLQWRADMEAGNGDEPTLTEVTVSYVQENLAPRIERFSALGPGEVLVPANFNPGNQVFEPTSPTRGGIFTTLEAADSKAEGRRKTLWKKGFQTLTWEVKDPNKDQLVFSLLFRREGASTEWLPMVQDVDETYYSFDAAALPDGTYRFLLRAADRATEASADRLVSEEIGEPVVVDNTVPELVSVKSGEDGIAVEISDSLSPLRTVRMSVDAGDWQPLSADDGLLDGRRERLIVPTDQPAHLLLLQVMDAAFNVVTFDLSEALQ